MRKISASLVVLALVAVPLFGVNGSAALALDPDAFPEPSAADLQLRAPTDLIKGGGLTMLEEANFLNLSNNYGKDAPVKVLRTTEKTVPKGVKGSDLWGIAAAPLFTTIFFQGLSAVGATSDSELCNNGFGASEGFAVLMGQLWTGAECSKFYDAQGNYYKSPDFVPDVVQGYPITVPGGRAPGFTIVSQFWSSEIIHYSVQNSDGSWTNIPRVRGWSIEVQPMGNWGYQLGTGHVASDGSLSDSGFALIAPNNQTRFRGVHGSNDCDTNLCFPTFYFNKPSEASSSGTDNDSPYSFTTVTDGNTQAVIQLPRVPYVSNQLETPSMNPPGESAPAQITTTVTGVDGSSVSCVSETFRASDNVLPKFCEPVVPDGFVEAHRLVQWGPLTAQPSELVTLLDSSTSAQYQRWAADNPECKSALPSGTTVCMLDLQKTVSGQTFSCFAGNDVQCADWFTDPNKSSSYTCLYNGKALALSDCSVYAPTFKSTARESGTAYADPATGAEPAVQTTPKPGAGAAPASSPAPDNKNNCVPSGWGAFNPVNWVLQPIGCALSWAFLPKSGATSDFAAKIKKETESSNLGKLLVLGGLVTAVPTWLAVAGNGCSGIPVHFQMGAFVKDFNLLDACAGSPLNGPALWTQGFLGFIVITASFFACLRYTARIFGFGGFGISVANSVSTGPVKPDSGSFARGPGGGRGHYKPGSGDAS